MKGDDSMTEQLVETARETVDDAALEELRPHFHGTLLRPGDGGYDQARALWNGMIDHRPALIARCTGAADVIAAVNFGRAHELTISVKGGGHNVAGQAVADGGLVIDLSAMRAVLVDPEAQTVRVQGGATFADLDHECQAFGLATTGGHVSHTGIGGLTTGGGVGWLARKYGLSSDNLLSADVVTADGRLVTASESQNQDLFWGIRGGGGNFGVVTSFTYRLYPLGTMIVGGLALWPLERGRDVLTFFRDFVDHIPDELSIVCVFITAPPLPFIPPELQGQKVAGVALCYAGDLEAGMRAVQPIKDLAPAVDVIGPMPYLAQQTLIDAANAHGMRYYLKNQYMDELSDAAINVMLDSAATLTSPFTQITFQHYQGAVSRLPTDATAYSHRDAKFIFFTVAEWTDPAEDATHIAWTRNFAEGMRPFSRGAYINFLGADEDDRLRSAYSPETYSRLAALKAKYDPDNVFHLNANIRPGAESA
jgi:FAD/FMN-containing dehydrogenase